MKKLFLILPILLSFTCIHYVSAQKQKYEFKGKIIDYESKEPLEFVTVQIPKQGLWAISDKDGNFHILLDKSGTYEYEIQTLGCLSSRSSFIPNRSCKVVGQYEISKVNLAHPFGER